MCLSSPTSGDFGVNSGKGEGHPRRGCLQQVPALSNGDSFFPVAGVQFAVETANLCLDRVAGDDQLLGNLGIGQAGRQEMQNGPLALA